MNPEFSSPPIRLGTPLFQKWFRRGPLRAGHGILSSTGGISECLRSSVHIETTLPFSCCRSSFPHCCGSGMFMCSGSPWKYFLLTPDSVRSRAHKDGGPPKLRKLEKAVAVRNSLLERFSGKFRRCWKMIPRFSGSSKCYPCQGLGIFRQGKRLLENWPRLRERCWDFFPPRPPHAFLKNRPTQ